MYIFPMYLFIEDYDSTELLCVRSAHSVLFIEVKALLFRSNETVKIQAIFLSYLSTFDLLEVEKTS